MILRTIFTGLTNSFNFEKPLIEHIACQDEVNKEILHLLYEAGSAGLFAKRFAREAKTNQSNPSPDKPKNPENGQTARKNSEIT